jgi:rubrerythrin
MGSAAPTVRATRVDRLLRPLHRWVWRDAHRRARKLLRFAETEADGGRDLSRAAERTRDPLLRRLYLRHASDEQRHAELFRRRGGTILRGLPPEARAELPTDWLAPGERGLDDLRVDNESEETLLAFLHLSEKAAAGRFQLYREMLEADPATRAVFDEILRDEVFHMSYTHTQLQRVAPARRGRRLWFARLGRLWRGYLRLATALAGVMGGIILTVQYFILLPPFAWMARRAQRRETPGWSAIDPRRRRSLKSQY